MKWFCMVWGLWAFGGWMLHAASINAYGAVPDGLQVEAALTTPHGMPDEDGNTQVTWRVVALGAGPIAATLTHRLRDEDGQTIQAFPSEAVNLERGWQHTMDIVVQRYGPVWYEATLTAQADATLLHEVAQRITRLPPVPRPTREEQVASFVGVNTHQWADWPLLARMGIHWARDYVWGWYGRGLHGTTTPQSEDFLKRLAVARASRVVTLPCIQKVFVTEDQQRWMDDHDEIVETFERIGNHFPHKEWFQSGNEEETYFPGHIHDPVNYAHFIRAASEGLRRAGHDQRLVLAGDQFMYPKAMAEVLALTSPDDFWASCIHIYTGTVPPERAMRDTNVGGETRAADLFVLDRIRDYVRMFHKRGHEVWITETGWDVTYGPAVGERLQAVWLPRMYLLSRWVGVDKIFWFFDIDGDGQVRFSSSGLLDLQKHVRPSGATLAALSAHTAGTQRGGSVDLGDPDVWCLLWDRAEGGGVATIWLVEGEREAPDVLRRASRAYDQYGNEIEIGTKLDDTVSYYHFDAWPAEWESMRHVELVSHRIQHVPLEDTFVLIIEDPAGQVDAVRSDASPTEWDVVVVERNDARIVTVRPQWRVEPGEHELKLVATGEGWERTWSIQVNVQPLLQVDAGAYRPGEALAVPLSRASGIPVAGKVMVDPALGSVAPETWALGAGEQQTVQFTAAQTATGAIPLHLVSDSGLQQTAWLRPAHVSVPEVDTIALEEGWDAWPAGTHWDSTWFAIDGLKPEGAVAWSPEGLYVAVRYAAGTVYDLDPEWFWTAQNMEILIRPASTGAEGWTSMDRHFWVQPVREADDWRGWVGQWRSRTHPGAGNINDHPEVRSHVTHADGYLTFNVFIPASALGEAPRAGETWRMALFMQTGTPTLMTQRAAWPLEKGDQVLRDPGLWGAIHFLRGEKTEHQ